MPRASCRRRNRSQHRFISGPEAELRCRIGKNDSRRYADPVAGFRAGHRYRQPPSGVCDDRRLVSAGCDLAKVHHGWLPILVLNSHNRPKKIPVAAPRVAGLDGDGDRAGRTVDGPCDGVERDCRRAPALQRADQRREERTVLAPSDPPRRPAILDVRREDHA